MLDLVLHAKAILATAIVSATLVWLLCLWRRPSRNATGSMACLAGCAGGLAAGCSTLRLCPAFPPANGLDRFLTIVLPLIIAIQIITVLTGARPKHLWLLRGLLAIVITRVLLHHSVYLGGPHSDWSPWRSALVLSISAVLLTIVWNSLTDLARRSQPAVVLLSLALTTQSAGIVILLAGYLKGGSAAILFAAALFGTSAGAMLCGTTQHLRQTVNVGIAGLFCLVFIGRFFGGLSTNSAVLLFASPLAGWATEIPALRTLPPQKLRAVQLLLVSLVLAGALLAAKRTFDREMAPLLGAKTVRSDTRSCEIYCQWELGCQMPTMYALPC